MATDNIGLKIETKKPKVLAHQKLCLQLNDIYERKNHDYGDSFHKTFVEEGMAMPRIRLSDKFERFKNLSRETSRTLVTDESIRDTLLDLANYALMTILEIDESRVSKQVTTTVPGQRVAWDK